VIAWHTLDAGQALARLGTHATQGLSEAEAQRRLAAHGPNRLPAAPPRPAWLRFLRQFHNVLIYVMLACAVVTIALGHLVDTAVLLGAVLVNAVIGFVQEGKAESALDAIRRMLSPAALVVRDGERRSIPAEALVPGDVVLLSSGDRVPADLRLVAARGLRADEAALTGESLPADKDTAPVPADASVGDRRGMLHSGTLVAAGVGTGVVVATGPATELGRIGTLLAQVEAGTTPLVRQMEGFSRWLALAIGLLSLLTFAVGVAWRGQPAGDMFMMVVALAAAAIPEGLPAILTITLALGVRRMARANAIVRRLPAVETLGAVSVVCSDKTGTLTCNEMTVQRVVCSALVVDVSGAGYAPEGGFHVGGRPVEGGAPAPLVDATRAALLCSDATLRHADGAWLLDGDPTEGALVTLAMKAGLDPAAERAAQPRSDAIPFESEHRFMATLHHDHAGGAQVFVKGAPERILAMCAWQGGPGGAREPLDPDFWRRAANDCAARALRVLAIAVREVPPAQRALAFDDVEQGLTLLALVGSLDPPREEARAAVADCHAAGIRVKMITGDHAETARAIGAMLGIGVDRPALTGAEVELLDDAALRRVVHGVDVFARASPEHKLRLVAALQAGGETVAMTGDGVNDAPALKRADIGVAMGRNGTEAAKDAADIVLADDHFATIVRAVREGRGIYDNIRKFVLFMLPTNGGEALTVLAAIVLGLALPLTPAQVLWINMVTSATLGLALAFEPTEPGVMARAPRPADEGLLSGFFAWRVLMVSVLMMSAALGLFLWELSRGAPVETARTMAVGAVVVAEMFYLLNSRFVERSVLSRDGLLGNRHALAAIGACLLLQAAFVHAPPLQQVFDSTDLDAGEWLRVVLAGALVFAAAETEKFLRRAWKRRAASAKESLA
jgi:magnesium-transporting ATPase (P-type)